MTIRGMGNPMLRSVVFGAVAKVAGSLTLLVGFPIVAHALPAAAYREFLLAISVASFTGLFVGAAILVGVRAVSEATASASLPAGTNAPDDERLAVTSDAFGFLLALSCLTAAVSSIVTVFVFPDSWIVLVAGTVLVGLTGCLMIGDVVRLAERKDYITSRWQVGGSIALLVLFALLSGQGLIWVVLIYFGVPLVTQSLILAQLLSTSHRRLTPRLSKASALRSAREAVPVLTNGFADYLKVYGAGLLVAKLIPVDDFVRLSTIVMLASRLNSPISLVTRPLLPNYIHALQADDQRWLRIVSRVLIVAALLIVCGIGLSAFVPPAWLGPWLPAGVRAFATVEIVWAATLLGGLLLTTILFPLYVARRQTMLFAAGNLGIMVASLALGYAATMAGVHGAMLTAVAAGAFGAGVVALVYLIAAPPVARQPVPA